MSNCTLTPYFYVNTVLKVDPCEAVKGDRLVLGVYMIPVSPISDYALYAKVMSPAGALVWNDLKSWVTVDGQQYIGLLVDGSADIGEYKTYWVRVYNTKTKLWECGFESGEV